MTHEARIRRDAAKAFGRLVGKAWKRERGASGELPQIEPSLETASSLAGQQWISLQEHSMRGIRIEPKPSPWLTPREVANELRQSPEQVRRLCETGKLRSVPVGTGERKHRRVHREWLDAFLRERERASRPAAAKDSGGTRGASRPPGRDLLGIL